MESVDFKLPRFAAAHRGDSGVLELAAAGGQHSGEHGRGQDRYVVWVQSKEVIGEVVAGIAFGITPVEGRNEGRDVVGGRVPGGATVDTGSVHSASLSGS